MVTSTPTWRRPRCSPGACTGSATRELEPAFTGNAYEADFARVPSTLRAARDEFASSELAEAAFGKDVVAHYLRAADVELEAFEAAVTDWERRRGFERF